MTWNDFKIRFAGIWEIVYPFIFSISIVAFVIILQDNNFLLNIINKIKTNDILELIITVESILFGFLLTILSLILQMDNKAITAIKKLGRYNHLIYFSQSAVISSLLTVIFSFIIILINDLIQRNLICYFLLYIWGFLLVFSSLNVYRFVRIFFVLTKSAH